MLLRALPGELPDGDRARPAAHEQTRRTRRGAPTSSGGSSGSSSCGGSGTREIRKINPTARFIPNTGGGATSPLDMKTIGELAPTLCSPTGRRGAAGMPPWANGKNGKEYRATMGRKPIGGIFSVGVEEPYRWKDSVQSGAEIRMWVADGVANGLRPWFTKFSGVAARPRAGCEPVEDLYVWHWRNERYLRNEAPLARVGLVYSQQTAGSTAATQARQKVEDHALGWYQALVEARIPFEMVHDRLLDAEHMAQFQTLILPNIAALSDEQCEQIRGVRRARRQARGDARDVALRRAGRAAAGLRPGRSVRRLVRGHSRGPDAELLPAARARPATTGHPLLAGPRRRAADHQRRRRVVVKPRRREPFRTRR